MLVVYYCAVDISDYIVLSRCKVCSVVIGGRGEGRGEGYYLRKFSTFTTPFFFSFWRISITLRPTHKTVKEVRESALN